MTKKAKKVLYAAYTPVQVLALSLDIYNRLGFVRSNEGYWNADDEFVNDSKTELNTALAAQKQPTTDQLNEAQAISDKFNGRFMMKKLTDSINSFEQGVADSLDADKEFTPFQIAIIASIPNMNQVDLKRQEVADRLEQVQFKSKHFGELKSRYDIEVEIVDCKFIQRTGVYIITSLLDDNIIKFWWRDQPDINDIIKGRKLRIRATVNKHEYGRFTKTQETMVNRVKILQMETI